MKFWNLKYGRGITQELFLWRRTLSFHTGIYLAGPDSMVWAALSGIRMKVLGLVKRDTNATSHNLSNTLGET